MGCYRSKPERVRSAWIGWDLCEDLSMALSREHYLPLLFSGAPWSGCSFFDASAQRQFYSLIVKNHWRCFRSRSVYDEERPETDGRVVVADCVVEERFITGGRVIVAG